MSGASDTLSGLREVARLRTVRSGASLLAALGCAIWLVQQPVLPAQQLGTSRFALTTVVDARGRPMVDVDPDDFVVQEGGRPREVLSLHVADYPIAVVVDNRRSAGRDYETIRRAASRFIGRVGHRPMAVVAAGPPRVIATFDDDRGRVVDSLEGLPMGPAGDGAGGLFDAFVTAARLVGETGAPFTAVVAVVGHPSGSLPVEFLTPILESGARVHIVAQQKASAFTEEASRQAWEAIAALTNETRGHFTGIYSPDSYQPALDRLADLLAPELMVEYEVPAGSPSGDVQLGVRIPGARVRGHGVSGR